MKTRIGHTENVIIKINEHTNEITAKSPTQVLQQFKFIKQACKFYLEAEERGDDFEDDKEYPYADVEFQWTGSDGRLYSMTLHTVKQIVKDFKTELGIHPLPGITKSSTFRAGLYYRPRCSYLRQAK